MQNVLQNLNKVDSLKALLGEYESTLHKADMVHESPSRNNLETLLRPDDCNVDLCTQRAEDKKSQLEKKLSKADNKDVAIDKKILAMTSKIRAQQNWVIPSKEDENSFSQNDDEMLS